MASRVDTRTSQGAGVRQSCGIALGQFLYPCRVGLEPTVPQLGDGSFSGCGFGVSTIGFPASATVAIFVTGRFDSQNTP